MVKKYKLALLILPVLGIGSLVISLQIGAASATSTMPSQPLNITPSEEVYVPEGEFLMGCSEDTAGALGCDTDARPIHAVYLDAFYIDKTEVTNAQYAECVNAGQCLPPLLSSSGPSRPDYYNNPIYAHYPVLHVDWQRAAAYCHWIGKRLPTEAEWEKAARGTDRRPFAWGNEPLTCDRSNSTIPYLNEQGQYRERACVGDTMPVESYPAYPSPYGALNMIGNVREWVSDFYLKTYYSRSLYYNPTVLEYGDKGEHLVRGGSWRDIDRESTTWVRLDEAEIYKTQLIGFRCARTATQGTPTATPTSTPSPTPTPYAVHSIGADGGAVWLTYPQHLTLFIIPEGSLESQNVITLTYNRASDTQDLQTNNHSFSIAMQPQNDAGTSMPQSYLKHPARLFVGYHELSGIISNTLNLYRLTASVWTTEQITKVAQSPTYIIADIQQLGVYGLLGKTNRVYLPVVLR